MFGKGWEELSRGFTSEQYSLALFNVLLNYLSMKGVLDIPEYKEFQSEHFQDTLKSIVENDEEERKKRVAEIEAKLKEREGGQSDS